MSTIRPTTTLPVPAVPAARRAFFEAAAQPPVVVPVSPTEASARPQPDRLPRPGSLLDIRV